MNNYSHKKIFVCSTEQSGDNIGKKILEELKIKFPHLIIEGVGGFKMKPFMNKQIYSIKDFKSMGIIEIILSIKKYINMINYLAKFVFNNNFDLIITIDSPDFNYPLTKKIRNLGYKGKIIHIVAPTVWAWRKYRAKNFAKIYDEIFTLFSFENKFFEKFQLRSTCIGHPIYNINNNFKSKKKYLIAFLPGSRLGEINSLFFFFQLAYEELMKMKFKYQIFIPTLPHLEKEILKRTNKWKIKTIITTNETKIENNFSKTKIALVCSGTASLEIAKRKIPQLVIYKLNYLTELIANFFVRVRFANIINILENKMIIPELVNSNLKRDIFIQKFNNLVLNEKLNKKQVEEVGKIINKIQMKKSPHKIAVQRLKTFL